MGAHEGDRPSGWDALPLTKRCERCGTTMHRSISARPNHWRARRFCSRRCRSASFPPPPAPKPRSAEERFWRNVERGRNDECWLWTGRDGRGRFTVDGKFVYAYRFAYELLVGPIPAGLVLDHVVCDNPRCVNPAHLEPTTQGENARRAHLGIRHPHPPKAVTHG